MAATAGRALVRLRVVSMGVGSKNVWGLGREAGVNVRDTVVVMGGRCQIKATGAMRGAEVEWLCDENEE